MGYIIFDIEANARPYKTDIPQQIIQIGAVKLNDALEEVDYFSEFIKPTYSPTISKFSQKQTGITQEEIDSASTFEQVYQDFHAWCDVSRNLMVCWGKEDIRFIKEDCILNRINDELPEGFIDILSRFKRYARSDNDYSVVKALEFLEIPQIGEAHSAIDDSRNTANIFKKIFHSINFTDLDEYKKNPIVSKTRRKIRLIVNRMRQDSVALQWDKFMEIIQANFKGIADSINEDNLVSYQEFFLSEISKSKPSINSVQSE